MHLSNLYPQWGGVDPRRCYWSCITSSCTCHPTKTAPSTAYHNVATSLTPPRGSYGCPLAVEIIFPYTTTGTPLSPTQAARVALLVRIFRQGSTFFFRPPYKFILSYNFPNFYSLWPRKPLIFTESTSCWS